MGRRLLEERTRTDDTAPIIIGGTEFHRIKVVSRTQIEWICADYLNQTK